MERDIKILFVDDEQNVLHAIKRVFLNEDYTILTATSAMDGLMLMKSHGVQVVVSDYRMPDINGI